MKLDEWLRAEGVTQKKLAEAIEVRESSLSNLIRGKHRPSLLTAIKIHKYTRGEVSYEDVLGEIVDTPPKSIIR